MAGQILQHAVLNSIASLYIDTAHAECFSTWFLGTGFIGIVSLFLASLTDTFYGGERIPSA